MGVTLADLIKELETGTVTIGGRGFAARALSATHSMWLRTALPRPIAPLGPDPMAGSSAPWIPNEQDAAYNAAVDAWWTQFRAASIAIAIDVELPKMGRWATLSEDERRGWAILAAAALCDGLSLPALGQAFGAISALGTSIGAAAGN